MDALFLWSGSDTAQDVCARKSRGAQTFESRRLPDLGRDCPCLPDIQKHCPFISNPKSSQIFYTAQTALAYSVGNVSHGMANNGMTDAQRAGLPVADPEYRVRCVPFRYSCNTRWILNA